MSARKASKLARPKPSLVIPGPPIQELTRHLADCPQVFLAEPVQPNGFGEVNVQAVVADLLRALGSGPVLQKELEDFRYSRAESVPQERNLLKLTLVACWLGSYTGLQGAMKANSFLRWLTEDLPPLAQLVNADLFVSDPEHREELARLCLSAGGILAAGETQKEAENKLDALDTVKRDAVVREAQAAEERARLLREEIKRKAAEQAASSVYGYE